MDDTTPIKNNVFDTPAHPNSPEWHNEETLFKVKKAIEGTGVKGKLAEEIIGSILNAGVVFRQVGIE